MSAQSDNYSSRDFWRTRAALEAVVPDRLIHKGVAKTEVAGADMALADNPEPTTLARTGPGRARHALNVSHTGRAHGYVGWGRVRA